MWEAHSVRRCLSGILGGLVAAEDCPSHIAFKAESFVQGYPGD